jgi:hypothetical protein
MADMRYFAEVSGEIVALSNIHGLDNATFAARFPEIRGRRYDSFQRLVGCLPGSREPLPVMRVIEFRRNPSLHKCDARCETAKGHKCECSCGGKHHGRAA